MTLERPRPRSLAEELERAQPHVIAGLCERTSLVPRKLARLDEHAAGWLKREIAEAVGLPVTELFPDYQPPRRRTIR